MSFSVGVSSFGDLRGVEQFVASEDVAAQVRSLCHEFNTQVAKNGDRLTVNEGIRSRERQQALYEAWKTYQKYGRPYASLAANPYTSTHDHTRGSALDFGITRADGTNRALTQAEFDWLHTNGVRRGIRWTGANFRPVEQWHHNGGYTATAPPIPDAPIIDTLTPEGDDDMSTYELVKDDNQTIWFVVDRMERRPLKSQKQVDDYKAFIRSRGQNPDDTYQGDAMDSFGVDITAREFEYQLIRDPKSGSIFLSQNRVVLVPLATSGQVADYQDWLRRKGYSTDVKDDSNLAAWGELIGK